MTCAGKVLAGTEFAFKDDATGYDYGGLYRNSRITSGGTATDTWLYSYNTLKITAPNVYINDYVPITSGNISSYIGSNNSARAISITGWGTSELTYLQTNEYFYGNSGWSHYIICNHGDGSNYYNYVLGLPFWGTPMYQRMEGGSAKGWQAFITSENVGSYALTNGLNVLQYNNYWLSPSRLQLMRYDGTSYSDRACVGVTDGNLHIDCYANKGLYLNYYSGNITYIQGTSQYVTSSGFYSGSDRQLKKNIQDIDKKSLDELFSVSNNLFKKFTWKNTNKVSYGLIAQVIKEYIPEAISYNNDGIMSINYEVAYAKILAMICYELNKYK